MSAAKEHSSQVDVRGFQYPLEPLRRKHEWQLAALETRLGRCHRALQESRQALAGLQDRHRQQLAWGEELAQRPFDPQSRQRLLACLVHLDEEILQARRLVEQRLQDQQQCQAACNEKRKKIEALDEHHDTSLKEFAEERARVQFAQLDRDWMAHRGVRQAAQAADAVSLVEDAA